jgi:hypothetical protein
MPAFNASRFLPPAIEAALRSTEPRFELLVLDDGSTDDTFETARAFAGRDPRVLPVRLAHRGLAMTANDGTRLARAPLIARMDADDISLPTRLERQLAYLKEHPDCIMVGSNLVEMDAEGNDVGPTDPDTGAVYTYSAELAPQDFAIPQPSVVARKEAMEAVGGYRAAFARCEDADLWFRLLEMGRLDRMPDRLVRYRRHGAQASQNVAEQLLGTEVAKALAVERSVGGEPAWDTHRRIDATHAAALAKILSPRGATIVWMGLARYHRRLGDSRRELRSLLAASRQSPALLDGETVWQALYDSGLASGEALRLLASVAARNPMRTTRRLASKLVRTVRS